MDFRPGQRVRCVNQGDWFCLVRFEASFGPAFGQICTIVDVCEPRPDSSEPAWLILAGFPQNTGYAGYLFRPLEDREMEKLAALAAEPPLKARELAELVS